MSDFTTTTHIYFQCKKIMKTLEQNKSSPLSYQLTSMLRPGVELFYHVFNSYMFINRKTWLNKSNKVRIMSSPLHYLVVIILDFSSKQNILQGERAKISMLLYLPGSFVAIELTLPSTYVVRPTKLSASIVMFIFCTTCFYVSGIRLVSHVGMLDVASTTPCAVRGSASSTKVFSFIFFFIQMIQINQFDESIFPYNLSLVMKVHLKKQNKLVPNKEAK